MIVLLAPASKPVSVSTDSRWVRTTRAISQESCSLAQMIYRSPVQAAIHPCDQTSPRRACHGTGDDRRREQHTNHRSRDRTLAPPVVRLTADRVDSAVRCAFDQGGVGQVDGAGASRRFNRDPVRLGRGRSSPYVAIVVLRFCIVASSTWGARQQHATVG